MESTFRSKKSSKWSKMDPPKGLEKRFGRWTYDLKDVLTDESLLMSGQSFIQKEDVLWFLYGGKYVLWENFKRQWNETHEKLTDFALPDGFFMVLTFRSTSSEDWSGGAQQAFEQHLVELGVEWFVYIKFYITHDGKVLPLVAGKSGSMTVNSTGSDLNFSMDVSDGPARCFLVEEGLQWHKTSIAVLPCSDEQEAYMSGAVTTFRKLTIGTNRSIRTFLVIVLVFTFPDTYCDISCIY